MKSALDIEHIIQATVRKHATNGFKNLTEEQFVKIIAESIHESTKNLCDDHEKHKKRVSFSQ